MKICNILNCIKSEIDKKHLKMTEFVEFMEYVNDPYLVLICCILSLRTNDKTTIGATKRMLKLAKTPKDMMKIKTEDLEHAIYPVGFYKRKAVQIKEISKIIVEKYNSKCPNTIEELTKFQGVGRKTANLVITKGFNDFGICVDVHVHRISNRIGLVKTRTPDETEMELRKILEKKYWKDINTLLVTLGQNICKSKPNCKVCPINGECNQILE